MSFFKNLISSSSQQPALGGSQRINRNQVTQNTNVMAQQQDINPDANLHLPAVMVHQDSTVTAPAGSMNPSTRVGQQQDGTWSTVHRGQGGHKGRQGQGGSTFALVTPIDLKEGVLVDTGVKNVQQTELLQNVPKTAVDPNTQVVRTKNGGYATVASSDLGDVSSGKLRAVNQLPKESLVTIKSPSMVPFDQPIIVQAKDVLNQNALIMRYGTNKKALTLAEAYTNGLKPEDQVTVAACHTYPGNKNCQAPAGISPQSQNDNLTAKQLSNDTRLTATQQQVQHGDPNYQVQQVDASQLNPNAVIKVHRKKVDPNVPLFYPSSQPTPLTPPQSLLPFSKKATQRAKQLPEQTQVQTQAGNVAQTRYVQTKGSNVRPDVQVHVPVQALNDNVKQLTQSNDTLYTDNAMQQNQGGQAETAVVAMREDLKDEPVMVNNDKIKPDQQVVRVTQQKSLAQPRQLKQGVKVTVPVSQVQPQKKLVKIQQGGRYHTVRAAQLAKGRQQRGGAGSDFTSSFYANTVVGGPAAISAATLQGIDNAPMFHPLDYNAVIPTLDSTGIVPSGLFMATNWPETSDMGEMADMIGGGRRSFIPRRYR